MKDVFVWLVVASEALFGFLYILQIRKKNAHPTMATWILFAVASSLSFVTYMAAEERDARSGILNTADLGYIFAILVAIIRWGNRQVRFEVWEKWYLAGAGVIVAYGLVTGDAWKSNLLTQSLMVVAYIPMLHRFIVKKKNEESLWAWLPLPAALAIFPAWYGGNLLAATYAIRSFISGSVSLTFMAYYQFVRPRLID